MTDTHKQRLIDRIEVVKDMLSRSCPDDDFDEHDRETKRLLRAHVAYLEDNVDGWSDDLCQVALLAMELAENMHDLAPYIDGTFSNICRTVLRPAVERTLKEDGYLN